MIKTMILLTSLVNYLAFASDYLIPPTQLERQDLLYDRLYNKQIFRDLFDEKSLFEDPLLKNLEQKQKIIDQLMNIKFAIISGNFERARVEMLKLKSESKFALILIQRYRALLFFLENRFEDSLNILSAKEFNISNRYNKICRLKVLNMIILDHLVDLENEWGKCRKNTFEHETSEENWLDNMVRLKLNKDNYVINGKIQNLKSLGFQIDLAKIYLKMALYMNKTDLVEPMIAGLPVDFFADDELRELMGHIYYRLGKFATAFDFLEDLDSPNAENIKGNIYLSQNKYELAYAQFKLALIKKENSLNAIERALPLAWLLKQWGDGINFTSRLHNDDTDKARRLTIETVFLIQTDNFKKARENLDILTLYSKYSQPHEVNQLFAYTALQAKDLAQTRIYSNLACSRLDFLNCWLHFQTNFWEDFPLTLKRDDPITSDSEKTLDTLLSETIENPINEDNFIDQRDIEELDNNLIKFSNN
jgi:hypothetical protein